MHKISSVACLLIILTGCFGPNFTPPLVSVPEEWRISTNEESTLCNLRWWEQFEDPVLNDLIVAALKNNQDLQLAIYRVLEFYASAGVVNSALFPEINGEGGFTRTASSVVEPLYLQPGIHRINNNYEVFANAFWELDFWGRLRSASEAAYAELLSQVEARRAVVISVVSNVANAYIILRELDKQLEISRRTLESRLESLKLANNRYHLGETSQLEVKQAESEVAIAAIRVIEFERDIPQQENQLSILLGENPRSIQRGRSIDTFEFPCVIPEGLPSDLLSRRPDILQAEEQLIAANARVSEAYALYFPQITLTGLYGSQSDKLRSFLTSPSEMWIYGVNAFVPLFNAGRTMFQVESATNREYEALCNYRQTILNAFNDVNNALIAVRKNRELAEEHQLQVKVLNEYLYLARLRYSEGEVEYLNVLDSERQLFDAQLQLVHAQSDTFTAIVQLYSALGGGWVFDADNTALNVPSDENIEGL